MAESVDALVSNTSGATRAGSTPALGTFQKSVLLLSNTLFFCIHADIKKKSSTFAGNTIKDYTLWAKKH